MEGGRAAEAAGGAAGWHCKADSGRTAGGVLKHWSYGWRVRWWRLQHGSNNSSDSSS